MLLAAGGAVFVAAFVQGVTGFAFGLLAIGALGAIYGMHTAVLILAVVGPFVSLTVWLKVGRPKRWREVVTLLLPLCLLGLPLGLLVYARIDAEALTRVVGGILVVSAVYFLSPIAIKARRFPTWVTLAVGGATGFLSGLTSAGGPPLVLYLYALEMDKVERVAVLSTVFTVASLVRVGQLVPTGYLTADVLTTSGVMIVPLVLGALLGQKLFRKIPAEPLRRAALVLLLGIGVALLVAGG